MLGGEQRGLRQVPVTDRGLQIFMCFKEAKPISSICAIDQFCCFSCSSNLEFAFVLMWNFDLSSGFSSIIHYL